ncbi:unnamed protein product, partial [Mycena citricolor]
NIAYVCFLIDQPPILSGNAVTTRCHGQVTVFSFPSFHQSDRSSVLLSSCPTAKRMSLPEELASERPYRSRKSRPCDRCRSRKQRCITKPSGTCLNCQISAVACTFDSPAAADLPRPRVKKPPGEAKSRNGGAGAGGASGSGGGAMGMSSGGIPLSPQSMEAGSSRAAQQHPFSGASHGGSSTYPRSPSLSMPGPVSPVKLETHLNSLRDVNAGTPLTSSSSSSHLDLGGAFSNIMLNWDPPSYLSQGINQLSIREEEDCRALDSDADDEFEPHYVGRTAERDALVLSAIASVRNSSSSGRPTTPAQANFRVRQVSTNQQEPIYFLFEPPRPYGEDTVGSYTSEELVSLLGPNNIQRLLRNYLNMDGAAVPIWRATDFAENPQKRLPAGLFCAYVTRGVIYDDQLRSLAPQAWKITTLTNRAQSRSARVSTIQANLLDLDGRPSLNPTGNSLLLGQTIAAARLMGLHLDCTTWSIPNWEKALRVKLWWAVLQQDKWAALCYGRSSYIHRNDWDVPLPPCETTNDYVFVAQCELTLILDEILCEVDVQRRPAGEIFTPRDIVQRLTQFGLDLDSWKRRFDSMGRSHNGYLPPGFRSLNLSYLGVALLLVRSVQDMELPPNAAHSAHESALKIAEEVVTFTSNLTADDLRGYFTTFSAFHFSTCLMLLIRLVLQADPSDHSDGARHRILHLLRVFIFSLSEARQTVPAFELADLALARARHLLPLLAKNTPEFALALDPLGCESRTWFLISDPHSRLDPQSKTP